jgi:uncharacterized metal-binding protein YceD (DUF177 family)
VLEGDRFKIYVDRLRNGKGETLEEELSPDFIGVDGEEIRFPDPVFVKGRAYTAEDNLVLHFDCFTSCYLPCSICNKEVKVNIDIKGFYYVESFDKIKGAVFNYSYPLREAILLESPDFTECNGGSCGERKGVEKYFKQPGKEDGMETHPFSELTI